MLAARGRAGSVSAGLRECGVRPAGRLAAVVFHPVRDRVAGVGGLVAGPAEPLPDRGDELLLLGGVAGGEAAPGGRGDEAGEADGFGVGGGEDPGGAELAGFGAGRDQDLGPAGPPLPRPVPFAGLVGPQVAADQEPGQHRVVGGRGAVAAEQPQVAPPGTPPGRRRRGRRPGPSGHHGHRAGDRPTQRRPGQHSRADRQA